MSPEAAIHYPDSTSPSRPLISVVIPVCNGAAYIGEAIDSVLRQTYQNLEILIVDDGSTDETLAVVAGFGDRVRLVKQPNKGHAAARNVAVKIVRGDWIAMLDADDLWHPAKLERQVALIGTADVIYTAAQNFEDAQRVDSVTFGDRPCPVGDVFDALILDNFITHSSALISRRSLLKCGGYDESLKTTCDWDLWLRMSAAGVTFAGCAEPLTHYRWRLSSNSKNHCRTCSDRIAVLNRTLRSPRGRCISSNLRRKALARAWQTSAWFVAEKDDRTALNWYLHSIRHRPYSIRGWKEVVRCCLHLCGISRQRLGFRRSRDLIQCLGESPVPR